MQNKQRLAHLLVKEAYALGAAEVIVQWSDDIINRERFLHADMDRIEEVPAYKKAEMEYLLAKKQVAQVFVHQIQVP